MYQDQVIGLDGILNLPDSIEFWLDGDNRIHERLKYTLIKIIREVGKSLFKSLKIS